MTEAETQQVVRMYEELRTDPQRKSAFFRLLKDKWPKLQIPELDAEDRFGELSKTHASEIEDLKRQMLDRDIRDRLERERGKLRVSPFNLSESEIEQVEKLMNEKGFPTHELAAEWYLKVTTPAKPSGFMSQVVPGMEDVQTNKELIKDPESELHKNPKKWGAKEFDSAWRDVFETGRVQFK